jgi:hypothetical protein
MLTLRFITPAAQWSGGSRLVSSPAGLRGRQAYLGGSPVEQMSDGTFGEYHRGIDTAPPGTLVRRPRRTVIFAGR